MSYHFGASNEPSIGSGRRVRASTRRYRRPLRRPRLACGEGPVLVVLGKRRGIPRAAACGNAAVARAHPAAGEARPRPAFTYRQLSKPPSAMAKKKSAAAKPAAKK